MVFGTVLALDDVRRADVAAKNSTSIKAAERCMIDDVGRLQLQPDVEDDKRSTGNSAHPASHFTYL